MALQSGYKLFSFVIANERSGIGICMKKVLKLYVLFLGVILLITVAACTKLCDSGYEGGNCNVEIRAIFEGTWHAIDTPGNLTYSDTIAPAASISGVTLSRSFAHNYFMHVIYASVSKNVVTISLQQPDSATFEVQGSGVINNNGTVIT